MALLQLIVGLALQSAAAGVEGYVTDDSTGVPIHGARIELADAKAWTVTDSLGYYALRAEQGGTQRLRVMRLGYETQALAVVLASLGPLRVDIALRAQPALMPLVRVSARPVFGRGARDSLIGDGAALGGRRWSTAQLKAHPALAEADALGAFAADADVSTAPESPTAFHVRGGSSDQVRFLIDGVPFYNAVHSSGAFAALNPDAFDAVVLHTGARTASLGGALAGTVDIQTRRPDSARVSARGGVSATALRLTVDGPVLPGRSDLVLSVRRGAPSLFAGRPDRTRLTGAFSDWLVKSTTRAGSGTLTLLATAANDRTAFSTHAESDSVAAAADPARHHFDWGGATVAALWSAPLAPGTQLTANAWRAEFDGDASWFAAATPLRMSSARQTLGLQTALVRRRASGEAHVGAELTHDRVAYRVRDEAAAEDLVHGPLLDASQSSLALFGEYLAHVGARWDVRPGVRAMLLASGPALVEPRLMITLRATSSLTLSGGLTRAYQAVQSLRNPESPAAAVFGVDLPILSRGDIPVARSDEATLGVVAMTGEHVRLSLDGYGRRLTGLAVAEPGTAVPFAVAAPAVGDGYAWGFGATVDLRHERLTGRLVAGAGRSRIDLRDSLLTETGAYQPGFATTHTLTAAAGYRVGETTALRSALFARWGRRTTLFDGPLDWEGCDALDGGCEIAGTPGRSIGATSGARLPAYLRWDIGVRRGWKARFVGRDMELDAYATIRNLLDRRNVWSWSAPGEEQPARRLMLRPLSVLTAGLDFRY